MPSGIYLEDTKYFERLDEEEIFFLSRKEF